MLTLIDPIEISSAFAKMDVPHIKQGLPSHLLIDSNSNLCIFFLMISSNLLDKTGFLLDCTYNIFYPFSFQGLTVTHQLKQKFA